VPRRRPIDPALGVTAMVEPRLLVTAAGRFQRFTDQPRTRRA
jgi:hypothetical protein